MKSWGNTAYLMKVYGVYRVKTCFFIFQVTATPDLECQYQAFECYDLVKNGGCR